MNAGLQGRCRSDFSIPHWGAVLQGCRMNREKVWHINIFAHGLFSVQGCRVIAGFMQVPMLFLRIAKPDCRVAGFARGYVGKRKNKIFFKNCFFVSLHVTCNPAFLAIFEKFFLF